MWRECWESSTRLPGQPPPPGSPPAPLLLPLLSQPLARRYSCRYCSVEVAPHRDALARGALRAVGGSGWQALRVGVLPGGPGGVLAEEKPGRHPGMGVRPEQATVGPLGFRGPGDSGMGMVGPGQGQHPRRGPCHLLRLPAFALESPITPCPGNTAAGGTARMC